MPRLMTLAVLATLAASAARANDPAAADRKQLQGEWQVVEIQTRGKTAGKDDPEVKNMRFVFDGDDFTARAAEGPGQRKSKFKLNPDKSPRELDITSLDGQEKGRTAAGIYKLEKDRLTICLPYFKDPSDRPKEFKAGAKDGRMVVVLERVKNK